MRRAAEHHAVKGAWRELHILRGRVHLDQYLANILWKELASIILQ
jgi:hypothetical protein